MYFDNKIQNNIGLPIPGVKLKLAPTGDMTELRVKGDSVTPGYFKAPDKTLEAFDEEGYLCTGDAVELHDIDKPELGLIFKGRVSENFKLLSGTWVIVGELRLALIAALSPLVTDVAICGQNQTDIRILIFPNIRGCQEVISCNIEAKEMANNNQLKQILSEKLTEYNSKHFTSSRMVRAAIIQQPQLRLNTLRLPIRGI